MRKDTALKLLTTAATIKELGANLDKEAGGIFCSFYEDREIHLMPAGFLQMAEALQATVTFDPNWANNIPDTTEGSFTVEIFEQKWRVFALFKKGEQA